MTKADLLLEAGRAYDSDRHDPDSIHFDDSYTGPSERELMGGCNRCGGLDDCYCDDYVSPEEEERNRIHLIPYHYQVVVFIPLEGARYLTDTFNPFPIRLEKAIEQCNYWNNAFAHAQARCPQAGAYIIDTETSERLA